MNILKKILIALLLVVVIIQFIPVDRSVPSGLNPNNDLIKITKAKEDVVQIVHVACYDCHSYDTEYPWYSYTAPAKWFLQNHINEGREHLNFSLWGTYSSEDKKELAEEATEELEEGHMPLSSYLWLHADAQLDAKQKEELINFFRQLERE